MSKAAKRRSQQIPRRPDAARPVTDADQWLRVKAWHNDGVVPVPFVGTSWRQRDGKYWRRRIGAAVLVGLLTLFVGAISTGFTIGILGGSGERTPLRVGLAVLYVLTAIPGFIVGLRRVQRPWEPAAKWLPRTFVPIGLIAFLIGPFDTGLGVAVLVTMFGHEFMNEGRAREVTEGMAGRG